MANTACEIFACFLCFVALLGLTVTTASNQWQLRIEGNSPITAAWIYRGLWLDCTLNSMGSRVCRRHFNNLNLPAYVRASQAVMILAMLLSLTGIILAIMTMKCARIGGDDPKVKGRVVGAGGVLNVLAGISVIAVVSVYAWKTYIDYIPALAPKKDLGMALYFGWVSGLVALVGGAMLCASCASGKRESLQIPTNMPMKRVLSEPLSDYSYNYKEDPKKMSMFSQPTNYTDSHKVSNVPHKESVFTQKSTIPEIHQTLLPVQEMSDSDEGSQALESQLSGAPIHTMSQKRNSTKSYNHNAYV
uniref:claudin-7-like n=1 Tax=Myxine glutinosa TaxID=7769 RepID=UPI00358EFC12